MIDPMDWKFLDAKMSSLNKKLEYINCSMADLQTCWKEVQDDMYYVGHLIGHMKEVNNPGEGHD